MAMKVLLGRLISVQQENIWHLAVTVEMVG